MKEISWREKLAAAPGTPARLSAIDIGNGDDISVGADEVAISHAETEEDINLVNTGNLTGGVGIEVSTGAINLADAIEDLSGVVVSRALYEYVYDDAGNVVSTGTATAEITLSYRDTTLIRDPLASRITIDNSGSINFSGREGISAVQQVWRIHHDQQFRRHRFDAGHRGPRRHLCHDGNLQRHAHRNADRSR